MLCRLGFKLLRACDVGDKCNVNVSNVISSLFRSDLTYCLKERRRLNISDCAADLCDDHIGIAVLCETVYLVLYLICDVRNDLNRAAEIIAAAFLGDDVPVNFTRCDVGVYRKILINEALVVTKVKVGLRTVIGNENFSVLIGRHSAGVNVYVWVKLLDSYLIAALFEKSAERSGGNTFAESRNDSARYENVLADISFSP